MRTSFRISFLVFSLAPLWGSLCGCAGPELRSVRAAEEILGAAAPPDIRRIAKGAARFRQADLSAARLKIYSDGSLDKVYNGLYGAAYTFPEDLAYARMQRTVLDEKSRRARSSAADVQRMHRSYVAARMFAEAGELAMLFPGVDFQEVPKTVKDAASGKTRWRAYDVPDGGAYVELKAVELGSGPKLVVTMFPGCAVAEKAMKAIMAEPELATVFRKYGMLLTAKFSMENARLWKTTFGFPRFYIAYKTGDFPEMDFKTSPNFYFMRDGKVRFHFFGWNTQEGPDSGPAQMAEGLQAIGVSAAGDAR